MVRQMMTLPGVVVALVALIPVGLLTSAANPPLPLVLRLERAPHLKGADLTQHATRGMLGSAEYATGFVQFPILQSVDHMGSPFLTRLWLGSPEKVFSVLVDTGSSTLWVSCTPCIGCPSPNQTRKSYDPQNSWSPSVVTGAEGWCRDNQNSHCGYQIVYGGGATTSGYYVSGLIHLDATSGHNDGLSTPIIFGCSDLQSGVLTDANIGFDGILGLGPGEESMTTQLNSIGLAPNVFSICLNSAESGDGILVLGEAVEPGIVYTPLIPSKSYYSVNLESIAIDGEKLPIDSSVFTSHGRITIVDSGTSLAYLVDEAYDPFVNAITAAVSPSVPHVISNGEHCFMTSASLESSFPPIILYFSGGSKMPLKPHNYLLPAGLLDEQSLYCIGWKRQQSRRQITIIGDIVLINRLIVHDLDNMRMGWADYDCSQSVNITNSHHWNKRHVNSAHASGAISIASTIALLLTHMMYFYI